VQTNGGMKAAILTAPGRFEVADRPDPRPGAEEVRVRVEGCGVCGSNLGPWEGSPWLTYPLPPGAPGHEAWGRVDAVGREVHDLVRGDRVAVLSYHGFAELDVAPAAQVVRLPRALDGRPFPGEPVACAVNVLARSGIVQGDTVVVVGSGFLGALLVRLARTFHPGRVVAVSRRPTSRAVASALGADAVVDAGPTAAAAAIEAAGGRLADVVIEATGRQDTLDIASELVRERGRLVIAGYHQDGPRTVNLQQWNWRGIDVVNAHERDAAVYVRGMKRAVGLAVDGVLDLSPLLTHAFPLERIEDAFRAMTDRPEGFMKAWIRM
jgi:threonine dehydrogenase-like Zn-dependent dehydrogenase